MTAPPEPSLTEARAARSMSGQPKEAFSVGQNSGIQTPKYQ
jgi:hypothetical protein